MITEGKYTAHALSATFGKSAKKGVDQVTIDFEIEGGAAHGERIEWTGFFSEDTIDKNGHTAAQRTVAALRLCGCTFGDGDVTNVVGIGSQAVEIVVKNEPWIGNNGESRDQMRVKWINPPRVHAEMDPAAKHGLASRMRGVVFASKPATVATPRTPARPSTPNGTGGGVRAPDVGADRDDGIPFLSQHEPMRSRFG